MVIAISIGGLLYLRNNIESESPKSNSSTQSKSSAISSSQSQKSLSTSSANSRLLTITETELARHNSQDDCYIAISRNVYDLSNFRHPSPDDFTVLCGMDITNSAHPGAAPFTTSKVLNQISKYTIGTLGN